MNRKPTDNNENIEEIASQETPLAQDEPTASTPAEDSQKDSIRPDDYAMPHTGRRERPQKLAPEGSDLDKDDADDFIFTKYRKVKHSERHPHHEHHHKLTPEEDMPLVMPVKHRHYPQKLEVNGEKTPDLAIPPKKEKKKTKFKDKPWWKKLLIILGIVFGAILGLLLILAITLVIMYFVGQAQLTDYSNIDMTAPSISGVDINIDDKGKTVTYKGQKYAFNTDITGILCMGVDKEYLGTDYYDSSGSGGQADAIFLIAFNTKSGETDVIAIPRDLMTDIGIYTAQGEYLKTERHQICLAYAYADGREKSCENTKTAVERLFYGLPVQSYFAMDLNAIASLNDAVGGVTVTLQDDTFIDSYGTRHYEGETVTLYGNDAVRYLRVRDITELYSTTQRMGRQINYLNAFSQKAISMTKQDLGVPLNLFSIVSGNSVTDLNPAKITAFATTIVSNGVNELNFKSVPGELTSDGTYAEFIADEEQLYEMILDTYYTPVN